MPDLWRSTTTAMPDRYTIWVRRTEGGTEEMWVSRRGQRAWLQGHAGRRRAQLSRRFPSAELRPARDEDLEDYQRGGVT